MDSNFPLAHELGAWLLHYSVAVLYKILPEEYYQHHLLLVKGIYLLKSIHMTSNRASVY